MASGSGEGKGRRHQDNIPSVVLLELWGHVADDDHRPDATTATSTTSTGLPISVTLCAATPPSLSHLSVDCPGLVDLDPNPLDKFVAPTVISTDADLVLLRVPVDRFARFDHCFSDYFVYKVHSHSESAKLHRLPSPRGRGFADDNIAILSCGNDDDDSYAVAALQPLHHVHFRLHLCRSTPDGKPGSWTSHQLTVEEPLRGTSRDTIKYVEMEFTILNSSQDPRSSYHEWVASQEFRSSHLDILVDDGSLKINTWNMPIPVTHGMTGSLDAPSLPTTWTLPCIVT
ncbi:Os05g0332250 [Oryza sativa Japonica Group]|uniref:Os05g0332250 protein n=1 Tax=Oryza sativa subsp. japonica TaxID=39947 RepID=A0A0N7KKK0_ORYSJ|nr:Os05g0332250 [Oryza sativa Japonica Group]